MDEPQFRAHNNGGCFSGPPQPVRDPFNGSSAEQERYRELIFKENFEDSIEVYKAYREKISHEDVLINFRTSWFVTLQAFLFTSFALSLGKFDGLTESIAVFGFALVGISACLATVLSLSLIHI